MSLALDAVESRTPASPLDAPAFVLAQVESSCDEHEEHCGVASVLLNEQLLAQVLEIYKASLSLKDAKETVYSQQGDGLDFTCVRTVVHAIRDGTELQVRTFFRRACAQHAAVYAALLTHSLLRCYITCCRSSARHRFASTCILTLSSAWKS